MPTPAPGHEPKHKFAERLGCGRSYVSALVKSGRAVVNEAGHVNIEESLRRIRSTTGAPERALEPTERFADARDKKEHYLAENARLDFEERCGKLMQAERVAHAVAAVAGTVRSRLENMPDQLAPMLAAAADEAQCRAILAEQFEALLSELSAGFHAAAIGADKAS